MSQAWDDRSPLRAVATLAAYWALAAFGLNLAWELAQLPFYTLHADPDVGKVARGVLYCTAGNVLVALGAFALTGLRLGDAHWPLRAPVRGIVLATALGLAFTAFSEWRAVYVLGTWTYTEAMPLVFGLGVAPLLQWLVLPTLVLLAVRGAFAHRGVHASGKEV